MRGGGREKQSGCIIISMSAMLVPAPNRCMCSKRRGSTCCAASWRHGEMQSRSVPRVRYPSVSPSLLPPREMVTLATLEICLSLCPAPPTSPPPNPPPLTGVKGWPGCWAWFSPHSFDANPPALCAAWPPTWPVRREAEVAVVGCREAGDEWRRGEKERRGESLSEQIWTPSEPEQCRPQKAATNQSTSISSVLVDLKKTKQKKERAAPFFLVGFTVKIHISLVPKMEKEK